MRETTSNVNGSQSTQYNPWNVNEWAEVEHVMESFDWTSMTEPVVEGEKPAIEACRFQGTDDFYINFVDNELSSIKSDPS